MKKTALFILSIYSFTWLNAQIKVASNGYVGINNTSPTYHLDVAGTVRFNYYNNSIIFNGSEIYPYGNAISLGKYGNMWSTLFAGQPYFTNQPIIISDVVFKKNVEDLNGANEKLKLIRPVKYDLAVEKSMGYSAQKSKQYGFIAQELMKVFPEMVDTIGEGIMGIRYNELIPVLVQAVKEQKAEINSLKKEIIILNSKISKYEKN